MARKYEASHPWIKFRTDLSTLSMRTWMLLGEARSKCEHLAGIPLEQETARKLLQISLAKGVHATTAIEGNTLSPEDVQRRVEGTPVSVPQSKAYQLKEVDNVIEAMNTVIGLELQEGTISAITPHRVRLFNALVLKEMKLEEGVVPGAIRTHSVIVGRVYRGAPAEDCEFLLDRLCDWLKSDDFEPPSDDYAVPFALLKAILAHLYLAWIHPFGDGNGRTARLIEVQILAAAGLPMVAVHLLSNHYNNTRSEYYRQLEDASKSGGKVVPFVEYAIQGLVEGLAEHIEVVRSQQWRVAWLNYVHEQFKRRKKTPSSGRMKDLVLELSTRRAPVPRRELTSLAPDLAVAYSKKTDKTLSRDLNVLEEMGLVRKEAGGYVAEKELVLAFLPPRHLSLVARPVAVRSPEDDPAPARATSAK